MTVPGNINDAGGNIVVEIECDSYYNSANIPSNWQTTSSGEEINVAYCGFDMVCKSREERACIAYMEKHCRLTFLFLLPLSNLFHCLCHVSPSILKTPKQVFFFNVIHILEHLLHTVFTVL